MIDQRACAWGGPGLHAWARAAGELLCMQRKPATGIKPIKASVEPQRGRWRFGGLAGGLA